MFIDKYKKDDCWIDEAGCQYFDAESFIEMGLFNFCGCGQPDSTREYVRNSLQLVSDIKELVWEKKMSYEDWIDKKNELFKTDEAEFFMWYWLDHKGYIEHGGSVPGWLTEDGKEILSDLNELKQLTNEKPKE